MKKRKIIVQLQHSADVESLSMSSAKTASSKNAKLDLGTFQIDQEYGILGIPNVKAIERKDKSIFASGSDFEMDTDPANHTYIVRGDVSEKDLDKVTNELNKNKQVVGVFADVEIEPCLICPGSPAQGTHLDVERLLCVARMRAKGMTGQGVHVAIVDTGINMAYLNAHGKNPNFNAAWSWKPSTSTITPGSAPVSHGTMCAFDVCIAAPQCSLLDIALLTTRATGPTAMSGVLSDGILAYSHLIRFMGRPTRPGENKSLVVNNSWGMFHPSWDFPIGNPGNYSHNPNHPFTQIVGRLIRLGADVLFAAGNCGPECPDGRCQNVTNGGIYGANSLEAVISVAGVATNLDRVGYSNSGPGDLFRAKPDITGYTHFSGSGVYSADGGTSAASPVVAGVVAAVRTVRPWTGSAISSPASIKTLLTSSARDLGTAGFDFLYGYGVVNGCKIIDKLYPFNICERYPRICELLRRDKIKILDFCRINPLICKKLERDFYIDIDRLPVNTDIATPKAALSKDELLQAIEYLLTDSKPSNEKSSDNQSLDNSDHSETCHCNK
ncbi:MAG: S8 family serine peptidase [Saprospiraceae bacterium]